MQAARCLGIGEDVFGKLQNHFQDMPIDGEEQFCMLPEHTFYIYLGQFLSGVLLHMFTVLLLEDFGKINQYAWGQQL